MKDEAPRSIIVNFLERGPSRGPENHANQQIPVNQYYQIKCVVKIAEIFFR